MEPQMKIASHHTKNQGVITYNQRTRFKVKATNLHSSNTTKEATETKEPQVAREATEIEMFILTCWYTEWIFN